MSDATKPQTVEACEAALAAFFPPEHVKWKPAVYPKGAGDVDVMPYIDVRAVCDRLDSVFGANRWETAFRELTGGNIECTLSVRFPETPAVWVKRVDVGSRSKQMPDPDDNLKTGYSDALKRAAVQLGVGRYLYRMGSTRAKWDGRRVNPLPTIPDHFLPPDCREAGSALADRAIKLVGSYTEPSNKPAGPFVARHLRESGIDPNTPLASCEVRVVNALIDRVHRAMQTLAKSAPVMHTDEGAPRGPDGRPDPMTQRIIGAVRASQANN